VVDTLGLPVAIQIQAASVQERDGGPSVIAEAKLRDARLALIWGDSGFAYERVDSVCREARIALEITRRPGEGTQWVWTSEGEQPVVTVPAFQVLHHRWVVERTFAWLGRYRRLSKDFEATLASSLAWIEVAFIRLLVQRFGDVAA
jgi:putative transposase